MNLSIPRSRIRESAVRLLLRQPFKTQYGMSVCWPRLPLIGGLAVYDTFDHFFRLTEKPSGAYGMSVVRDGINFILYESRNFPNHFAAYTICHEIGHLTLLHDAPAAVLEAEADVFADEYLVPDCVVRYLCKREKRRLTTREFQRYFYASELVINRRVRSVFRDGENVMPSELEFQLLEKLFDGPPPNCPRLAERDF